MLERYGVWQEKTLYGRQFMGIVRVSYLIGPDGEIAKVYPKVSPKTHADEVLADLRGESGAAPAKKKSAARKTAKRMAATKKIAAKKMTAVGKKQRS